MLVHTYGIGRCQFWQSRSRKKPVCLSHAFFALGFWQTPCQAASDVCQDAKQHQGQGLPDLCQGSDEGCQDGERSSKQGADADGLSLQVGGVQLVGVNPDHLEEESVFLKNDLLLLI